MHWNVAPDALPGSARLVRVLDRWLNYWEIILQLALLVLYQLVMVDVNLQA